MTISFDPILHEYTDETGRIIQSPTQLIKKHSLGADYSNVPNHVFEQASERGTLVHSQFEKAIKSNGLNDSDNAAVRVFLDTYYPSFTNWQSEQLVWIDGEANRIPLAGTLDLVCYAGDGKWLIGDIKTTSTLHSEAISWQLSMYRMMWCYLNHVSVADVSLFCLHVREDKCKWIDIMPISTEDLQQLFWCESEDVPFFRTRDLISSQTERMLADYQNKLVKLDAEKKNIEAMMEKAKRDIFNTLYSQGIKKFDTNLLSITVVAPSTSTTIDSKRLKAERPEIYEEFSKTSTREGYVRISAK